MQTKPKRPWTDESILRSLYVDDHLTTREVGEKLGCSDETVRIWLDNYGIDRRPPGSESYSEPYRDENVLRKLHHDQEMSVHEIGDVFGVNGQTILNWMNRFGVKSRDPGIREEHQPDNSGRNNGLWKEYANFQTTEFGYERSRSHWNGKTDYLVVHRLAAVAWFGLEDVKGNVVHHINGIPWDNREENLALMSNENHVKLHWENGDYE